MDEPNLVLMVEAVRQALNDHQTHDSRLTDLEARETDEGWHFDVWTNIGYCYEIKADRAAHYDMDESNDADTICSSWHITDVQSRDEDLTDDQARDILHAVDHKHDANEGINWEVIDVHIANFRREEEAGDVLP